MSRPSTVATPAALIHDPLWSCPQPGITSDRAITHRGSSNSECLRGGARRVALVSGAARLAAGETTPAGPISITPLSCGGTESVPAKADAEGGTPAVEPAEAVASDRNDRAITGATRVGATIRRSARRKAGGNAWESNPPRTRIAPDRRI